MTPELLSVLGIIMIAIASLVIDWLQTLVIIRNSDRVHEKGIPFYLFGALPTKSQIDAYFAGVTIAFISISAGLTYWNVWAGGILPIIILFLQVPTIYRNVKLFKKYLP